MFFVNSSLRRELDTAGFYGVGVPIWFVLVLS